MEVLCEFPKLILTWTLHPKGRPGFDAMGSGVIFEGSNATMVVNYNQYEIYVKGKREENFQPPPPQHSGFARPRPRVPGRHQVAGSGRSCDIEYGHRVTKGGLLANIAYRTGERLYWDDEHERFTGRTDANRYVTRRYRKPWKLG